MLNLGKNSFKIFISICFVINCFSSIVCANESQFDSLRFEISNIQNKNSDYYLKTKNKLHKHILKNNIDYSNEARLDDVSRLISEQKYNIAKFELESLIEANYETSKCYELLGDISLKIANNVKKVAYYYKEAVRCDAENISAIYKLANLYLSQKKNILAIENFKLLVSKTDDLNLLNQIQEIIKTKILPSNRYEANNLYEILGDIYLKQQNMFEVYQAYDKAIKLNPSDIYLKYYLSNAFYLDNKNERAIILFNQILNENPHDIEIKLLKANALRNIGNLAGSQREYSEILSLYPDLKDAKYGLYKVYESKADPQMALLKTLNLEKNYILKESDYLSFAKFLDDMGDYNAANCYKELAEALKKEELAKIQKENEAKKIVSVSPEIHEKTKVAKKEKKIKENNKNSSKKEVLKLEKKESINTNIQKAQNEKSAEEKRLKEQKATYEKEKELAQKEIKNAINNKNKNYLEKKAQIEKYENINPKTIETYFALANTYKQINMPMNALFYYKEARKLNPAYSDVYFNLGLIYFELNSSQTAREYLIKAINLDNENQKAKNLLAFVNQNIVTKIINSAYDKYSAKNYIEAFEILDDGIKKYPDNSQLHYYRALVFAAMKRNAAAIIDFQKSIELDHGNYMAYYQLGSVYEKINDEKSALVAYERFLSIEPEEKELVDEVQKKVIDLSKKYY